MAAEGLAVTWFPTFKCQLKCGYCVGRALPIGTHGQERPPEDWSAAFAACPQSVRVISASGREATLYRGMTEVLESVDWPVRLETNLLVPPSAWLTAALEPRIRNVTATLHHHPQHKKAQVFVKHLDELIGLVGRERVKMRMQLAEHDLPSEVDEVTALAKARRIRFKVGKMCETFLWRDILPLREPVPECTAGYGVVILMPDGAAYRCVGQAYYARECLGNIFDDGWDVLLEKPERCDVALCTVCNVHRATQEATE